MRAHFGLPSVEAEEDEGKPPIKVKFEIPYFTVSGIQVRFQPLESSFFFTRVDLTNKCIILKTLLLRAFYASPFQVRYLKIIEKSGYQALPWVRYITQNGGMFSLHCSFSPCTRHVFMFFAAI